MRNFYFLQKNTLLTVMNNPKVNIHFYGLEKYEYSFPLTSKKFNSPPPRTNLFCEFSLDFTIFPYKSRWRFSLFSLIYLIDTEDSMGLDDNTRRCIVMEEGEGRVNEVIDR